MTRQSLIGALLFFSLLVSCAGRQRTTTTEASAIDDSVAAGIGGSAQAGLGPEMRCDPDTLPEWRDATWKEKIELIQYCKK
jgi:hypothetical protein